MKPLTIKTYYPCDVTVIPNRFFDEYMPRANGEFVKIYFYLLRMTGSDIAPSLGQIADRLNYTEKDIIRALRYWEKEGLLIIEYDDCGVPLAISLVNMCGSGIEISPANISDVKNTDESIASGLDSNSEKPLFTPIPSTDELPAEYADRRVTTDRMLELGRNEEIREMNFVIQQYMGKPLNSDTLRKFYFFYDELHFSTDLITFLVEYCIEKEHKSMRYIEKVALNWYNEGITTVRDARKNISSYKKEYFDIFKALGINGRNPIDAEIMLMKKWLDSYGFSMEIITEACTRTIFNTKKPSLQYVDGILNDWHKKGAITMEDIAVLDKEHAKSKASAPSGNSKPAKPNNFNNFEQRNTDYASLEKQLLGYK